MAAPSSYIKTNTMGVLTIINGATTLQLDYDRGDVAVGDLASRLNEAVKIEARGKFKSLAYGDRIYPQFSFSAYLGNIIGNTAVAPGSLVEILTGLGAYSALVPSTGVGRPMTNSLKLTIRGTTFGESSDETLTAADVFCSFKFSEDKQGNKVDITGDILTSVTVVNGANTVIFQQIA